MGNFTDDLFAAAKQPGNVQVGSTRYSMAEVSFFLTQTPKELLGGVVAGFIQQMEKAGQYGPAKEMHANPQPFYGNPQCLAVFMACSIELDKRDERIEKLERAVTGLADVLRSVAREQGASGNSNETFIPAIDEAVATLAETP